MNGSALFFVPTLLPSEKGKAKMNQNELCGYQRKAVPLPPKSAEHAENPEQSTQNRYTI